jgi:hypothetical protein
MAADVCTLLSLMHIGVQPEKRGRSRDDAFEALAPMMRALVLLQLKQRPFDEMDASSAAMREYVRSRGAAALAADIAVTLPAAFASFAHQYLLTAPRLNALAVLLFAALPGEYRRRDAPLDLPALRTNSAHDVFRLLLYRSAPPADADPLLAQTVAAGMASDAPALSSDATTHLETLSAASAQKSAQLAQLREQLRTELADFSRDYAALQRKFADQSARLAADAAEALSAMHNLAVELQTLVGKQHDSAAQLQQRALRTEQELAAAETQVRDFRRVELPFLSLAAEGPEPWRGALLQHSTFAASTVNGAVLQLAPTLVPRTAQSGGGLPRPPSLQQYLGRLHYGAQMLQLASRLDFLSDSAGYSVGSRVLVVDVYFDDDGARAFSTYDPDAPGRTLRASSAYSMRAFADLFAPLKERLEPNSESALLYDCLSEVVERSTAGFEEQVRGFATTEALGKDLVVHLLENTALLNAAMRYSDFSTVKMSRRYKDMANGLDAFAADVQRGVFNYFGKALARALRALLVYAWMGDSIKDALFDVCGQRFSEARVKREKPAAAAPQSGTPLEQARAALGSDVYTELLNAIGVAMERDYGADELRSYALQWADRYDADVLQAMHTYLQQVVRTEEAEVGEAPDADDAYVVFRDVVGALAFDKREAALQAALRQEEDVSIV